MCRIQHNLFYYSTIMSAYSILSHHCHQYNHQCIHCTRPKRKHTDHCHSETGQKYTELQWVIIRFIADDWYNTNNNDRDTQNIITTAIILTLQHLHNPLEKAWHYHPCAHSVMQEVWVRNVSRKVQLNFERYICIWENIW